MDITMMNKMLDELDDVISSEHSTQLEVDLAECTKACIARISLLESKLVHEILYEEIQ